VPLREPSASETKGHADEGEGDQHKVSRSGTLRLNAASLGAVLGLVLCFALVSPAAAAEEGLPLGDLVVKPSIGVHLLYDSNVDRVQQNPQGDLGVQVTPALGVVYPGNNFRWELDASYLFFSYFNLGGNDHSHLRRLTNFNLGTSFDVNRQGKVGFFFGPYFANRPVLRGVDATGADEELTVATPLQLRLRPSKAFNIDVNFGWQWWRTYFGGSAAFNPNPLVTGNHHTINGGMSVAWRFFPRSTMLLDLDVARSIWVDNASAFSGEQISSWTWSFFGGLKGDITRGGVLSFMAQIGYANRYFDGGGPTTNLIAVEGLMGRVELAIRPVLTHRIAFGFDRGLGNQYYSSRIVNTQAYVKYKGLLFDRLAITADFSWLFRVLGIAEPRKTEHQWSAGAGVDILITQWLHATVDYRFSMVNPAVPDTGEYIDNRVMLGVVLGFK